MASFIGWIVIIGFAFYGVACLIEKNSKNKP